MTFSRLSRFHLPSFCQILHGFCMILPDFPVQVLDRGRREIKHLNSEGRILRWWKLKSASSTKPVQKWRRLLPTPGRRTLRAGLALLAPATALAAPQTTPDAFDAEITPGFRGSTAALYAGWDAFTLPFGGANLPDDPASDLAAGLEQSTPGAFITSSGNIYSPGAAPTFALERRAPSFVSDSSAQPAARRRRRFSS